MGWDGMSWCTEQAARVGRNSTPFSAPHALNWHIRYSATQRQSRTVVVGCVDGDARGHGRTALRDMQKGATRATVACVRLCT